MEIVEFKGYGVNAETVYLNAENILHWSGISYNGNHGTKIIMTEGIEVLVEHFALDVANKIQETNNGSSNKK